MSCPKIQHNYHSCSEWPKGQWSNQRLTMVILYILSRCISARRAMAAADHFSAFIRIPSPTASKSNRGSLISFSPYRPTKEKGKRTQKKRKTSSSRQEPTPPSPPPRPRPPAAPRPPSQPPRSPGPLGSCPREGLTPCAPYVVGGVASTKSSASRPLASVRVPDVGAAGFGWSHRATTWS